MNASRLRRSQFANKRLSRSASTSLPPRAFSIVRRSASSTASSIVDRCVQVLGSIGITRDTVVERTFRDIRPVRFLDCLRNCIARFKIPRRVFFVGAFPLTGSGKFQKYLLREQAQTVVSG
jgi:acyl-CoA synthetase (AMP-forming)/AMP-acid ligase II